MISGGSKNSTGEIHVWLREAKELRRLKPQGVDSFVKWWGCAGHLLRTWLSKQIKPLFHLSLSHASSLSCLKRHVWSIMFLFCFHLLKWQEKKGNVKLRWHISFILFGLEDKSKYGTNLLIFTTSFYTWSDQKYNSFLVVFLQV